MKKTLSLFLALFMMAIAISPGYALTNQEALKLVYQDEVNAEATYQKVIEKFPSSRVFKNIARAEQKHQNLVKWAIQQAGLDIDIPIAQNIVVKETLEENLKLAIEAEKANLELYNSMKESDLPEETLEVIDRLIDGSNRHLQAFTKNLEYPQTNLLRQQQKQNGQRGMLNQRQKNAMNQSMRFDCIQSGN